MLLQGLLWTLVCVPIVALLVAAWIATQIVRKPAWARKLPSLPNANRFAPAMEFFTGVGPAAEWKISTYTTPSDLGDLVYSHIFGLRMIICSDPEKFGQIMTSPEIDKGVAQAKTLAATELHRGLFGVTRRDWARQRPVFSPWFRTAALAKLLPRAVRTIGIFDRQFWSTAAAAGEPCDLFATFKDITTAVICRDGFGLDLTENLELLRKIEHCLASEFESITGRQRRLGEVFPYWRYGIVFDQKDREWAQSHKFLLGVVDEMIAKRQAQAKVGELADADDILAQLLRNHEAEKLSREELAANCVTFLLAGMDTTANTLAFAADFIARHPHVQDRLRAEIRSVISDEMDLENTVTEELLAQLPFMRAVIKETQRLRPIGFFLVRRTLQPVKIFDLEVPKDVLLISNLTGVNFSSKYYDDPLSFKPERWMGENAETFPFNGFGVGSRMCIGSRMAKNEAQLVLIELLRKYRLHPIAGMEATPVVAFALTVKGEKLLLRLEKL